MTTRPDPVEAADLVIGYYQYHRWRLIFHLLLVAITAGVWAGWFIGFYIFTLVGIGDLEKMRDRRDAARGDD